MSGHCDFCGIWHSGSCCHPGRIVVAQQQDDLATLRAQVADLTRERDELKERESRNVTYVGAIHARLATGHWHTLAKGDAECAVKAVDALVARAEAAEQRAAQM